MRVLYSFPHRLGVTGIGMTAWHQVAGIAAQGAAVTLLCGSCERPIPKVSRVIETMRIAGLRVPYRMLGQDRVFRMHDGYASRFLKHSRDRPDVVHTWPLGALETLSTAKRLGVPAVLERPNAHTAFAYEIVQKEFEKLGVAVPRSSTHVFNPKRLAKEELEYGLAAYLLCSSEFVARTFRDRGISAGKLLTHQYGYDPEAYFPDPDIVTRKQRFCIAFVGTCEPRKGLHYALDAWLASGVADTGEFLICGKFVPGYREFLEPKLQHPSIKVMGFVSDVPGLMRKCDALVLPSIEEGSALVTYEARGSGCVLLVSEASGAICVHGQNALVHTVGDVGKLAVQMHALAVEPGLLQRLRSNSLGDIDSLSWDSAAKRLMDVYKRVMSSDGELAVNLINPLSSLSTTS